MFVLFVCSYWVLGECFLLVCLFVGFWGFCFVVVVFLLWGLGLFLGFFSFILLFFFFFLGGGGRGCFSFLKTFVCLFVVVFHIK